MLFRSGAAVVPSVGSSILFSLQLLSNNHVLCCYGDSLGVNCTKVGVLVNPDKVHLDCFLEGQDCHQVKPDVGLDLLGNLPNNSLEGSFGDFTLGALLELANLSEGNDSRSGAAGCKRQACAAMVATVSWIGAGASSVNSCWAILSSSVASRSNILAAPET